MAEFTENKDAPQQDNPIVGSAWENTYTDKNGVEKKMLKIRLSNKYTSVLITDKDELVLWENENKPKETSPDFMVKVSTIQKNETTEEEE